VAATLMKGVKKALPIGPGERREPDTTTNKNFCSEEMTMQTMLRLLGSLAAIVAVTFGHAHHAAMAQSWPARPVTLIVPFGAGATSDIVGRGLAQYLTETLGQSFVVENRGGAGGNIGAAAAARAPQDGYTLLLATTGPAATNQLMYQNMPFDPQKDFAPVALLGKSPILITARVDAPFSTLKELIAYASARPDSLNGGFPGNGALGHITGILLQNTAGIKFGTVQYKGSAAIITDLIGKNIDIAMDSMAAYVPTVQGGQVKAIAIASAQRWPKLPNVMTASESGLPGFEASVWYALLAPAGTPADIVAKLNAAANAYLKSDKAKSLFDNLGIQPAGGTSQDLREFMEREVQKWSPIIKAASIKF
jgi:tripartite-type tricarboxylate transporter receptor subunit TctC